MSTTPIFTPAIRYPRADVHLCHAGLTVALEETLLLGLDLHQTQRGLSLPTRVEASP